jgi:hypothetical protein
VHNIQYESLCKYKYRLLADLVLESSINGIFVRTEYIDLQPDGRLTLRKGYAWDGASGPTIDTDSTMAGSAGHDALYQLIELKAIPAKLRAQADDDLRRWCIQDGMHPARATYWHEAVRVFGGLFA